MDNREEEDTLLFSGDNETLPLLYALVSRKKCACRIRNCTSNTAGTVVYNLQVRLVKTKEEQKFGKIVARHRKLIEDAFDKELLKTKANKPSYVSCHHYDPQALDQITYKPFCYIRDENIAKNLYGDENYEDYHVEGHPSVWYVVPTSMDKTTASVVMGRFQVPNTPVLNQSTGNCDANNESAPSILTRTTTALCSALSNVMALGRRKRKAPSIIANQTEDNPPKRRKISEDQISRRTTSPLDQSDHNDVDEVLFRNVNEGVIETEMSPVSDQRPSTLSSDSPLQKKELFHSNEFNYEKENSNIINENMAQIGEKKSVSIRELKVAIAVVKDSAKAASHGMTFVPAEDVASVKSSLNDLAINIMKNAAPSEGNGGSALVTELKYRDSINRPQSKSYVELKKIKNGSKEKSTMSKLELDRRNSCIYEASGCLDGILKLIAGAENDVLMQDIVEHFVQSKFGTNILISGKEGPLLDHWDWFAIRKKAGEAVGNREIQRIADGIADLTAIKRSKIRPPDLRSKIGKAEAERTIGGSFFSFNADIDDDKQKSLIYFFIKKLPLLFERLVESAYHDKKYQDSLLFSNMEDTDLFYRGIDRGGGDTLDLARFGNRIDGNGGQYAVTLSCIEGGAETYRNLAKTCFSIGRSPMFDLFDQRRLYSFTLVSPDAEGNQSNTKCIIIEIKINGVQGHHDRKVNLNILKENHDVILADSSQIEEFNAASAFAEERTVPGTIDIQTSDEQDKIHMDVILVKEKDDTSNLNSEYPFYCRGLKMYPSEGDYELPPLYSFRFDVPLAIIDRQTLNIKCRKASLLHTNDAKLNNTILGLVNCSKKHACPYCIQKTDLADTLPAWVEHYAKHVIQWDDGKYGPNPLLQFNFVESERRTGEHSPMESWETYKRHKGTSNSEKKSANEKRAEILSKSISKKPLPLHIESPFDAMPQDPLHLFEGKINHLIKAVLSWIKEHPGPTSNSSVHATKEMTLASIESFIQVIKASEVYKKSSAEYKKFKSQEKTFNEELSKLEAKFKASEDPIAKADMTKCRNTMNARMKGIQDKMNLHVKGDLGNSDKVLRGLKKFKKIVQERKDTKSNKEDMDAREFAFTNLTQIFAGDFKKEHGGRDLTAKKCLLFTERFEILHKIITEHFHHDHKFCEMMDWVLILCRIGYKQGLLYKSQEKITPERCEELKINGVLYVSHWVRKCGKTNPIYLKMHMELCALIPFACEKGMCGHVRLEAFEGSHAQNNQLKRCINSIVQTSVRTRLMLQRRQTHTIPEVSDRLQKLEVAKRGAREKPHEGMKKYEEDVIDVSTHDEEIVIPLGGALNRNIVAFKMDYESFLPKEFEERYNRYVKGKVPKEYYDFFESSDLIGSKAKNEMKFHK